MNPFLRYVEGIQAAVKSARTLTVSGTAETVEAASKVLLFSPHPDDECITGLLPLRLMREAGRQIINIPVTFGSQPDRQEGRARELHEACAYLGWDNYLAQENFQALDVSDVVGVLEKFQPEIIFVPHANDWNVRHIATHHLVIDALKRRGSTFRCTVVETEFWGAMDDPNLMVEGRAAEVADLVAATSLHTGEVARNPYHVLLPAWMQDNVRRGGELVGGQGEAAPDFDFATLYRLRRWEQGRMVKGFDGGKLLAAGPESLQELF